MNLTLQNTVERNPKQDYSAIDNEVVMLNQETGEYYALNEVGSRIWELLSEPICIHNVIEILVKEFEVEFDTCKTDTIQLLNELLARSLIVVNDV